MNLMVESSASPLWPAILTASATLMASLVALFGDRVRSHLFKPRLHVVLLSDEGELVPQTIITPGEPRSVQTQHNVRWYHLKISNDAAGRWPTATDVRPYLCKLEEDRLGMFVTLWEHDVPLTLRHEAAFNPRRNLGPPMISDFVAVTETGRLEFQAKAIPNNTKISFRGSVRLRATVKADSVEVTSPYVSFLIHWDGGWTLGASEMKKHMIIVSEGEG